MAVLCTKRGDEVHFHHGFNYESRGHSVEFLIRAALERYPTRKDFDLHVHTTDHFEGQFSFSSELGNYDDLFPCYLYHCWPETGLLDYTETVNALPNTPPETDKLGWIGSPQQPERAQFCERAKTHPRFEGTLITWNRANPARLDQNTSTFMTFQQQVARWQYLIDFAGYGYSARTKLLLSSPRIVFIVDRPWKEWFYPHMAPWKHYIPVRRDLADLEENFQRVDSDPDMQVFIRTHQREFAQRYLTRDAAVCRVAEIIDRIGYRP